MLEQKRYLKTLDVRVYKPLGTPIEFRFYQRYTTHPYRHSGVQFLSHYEDHRRWNIKRDFIDYLHWGKEQGQAHLPHRHQRVAFDFNDSFHPTALPSGHEKGKFENQDPSFADGRHPDLSSDFDPNSKVFSWPEHMNRAFSQYLPHQYKVELIKSGLESKSLASKLLTASDTLDAVNFGVKRMPTTSQIGRIPGIHFPYKGEMDRQHMQAMSIPLVQNNTIMGNDGRFSKIIYINYPARNNIITHDLAVNLNEQIDMATNAVFSKLVVLKAAQSGLTDFFSAGADLEQISFDISMSYKLDNEADALAESKKQKLLSKNKDSISSFEIERLERKYLFSKEMAKRHRIRVDETLRSYMALLWRIFISPRPLMTFVNGRCNNLGCGIALLARHSSMRDSTEFTSDSCSYGLTPFGGITNFLARPETSGKYPGLAEYILLTGNALYAGDALRLGWTDLFTTLEDMDFHIKQWFNDTEHMHSDAIAWQLGQLLDTCFRMKSAHNIALERCSITPLRGRWIEDAFADQPSIEAIISTLTQMENLPVSTELLAAKAQNTLDINNITPNTIPSVEEGVKKLKKHNMHFALTPWDIALPVSEDIQSFNEASSKKHENLSSCLAEVFTQYVFEQNIKNRLIAVNRDKKKLKIWRTQRYKEYNEYIKMMNRPIKRHVFAKIDGCDGKMIDFEFFFSRENALKLCKLKASHNSYFDIKNSVESTFLLPGEMRAMLNDLRKTIALKAGFDPNRKLEISWYLPTLDTCRINNDDELMTVLQNDPGVEAPDVYVTNHPPIYFLVKRPTLYMSEWAYVVKHQLLLSSPFALKATFQMIKEIKTAGLEPNKINSLKNESIDVINDDINRNEDIAVKQTVNGSSSTLGISELDTAEAGILSISETLDTEFRYLSRMVFRSDFYKVGYHSHKTMDQWEELEQDRAVSITKSDLPIRPLIEYDDVFERDVTIDGHRFLLRPRWSPRLLKEVNEADVAALSLPLDFEKDNGLTEIHVPTYTNMLHRVPAAINDIGGFEVVPGLGTDEESKVPPLKSDAHVPKNVNFYQMARHPWMDFETSLRLNGFTEGSMEYMKKHYHHAVKQVYGNKDGNEHNYWATKDLVEGDNSLTNKEQALLQDRFYNVLQKTESKIESWASTLQKSVKEKRFNYPTEFATQQERIYDDNFYRWFIRPGEHPNPSGLLKNGQKIESKSSHSSDVSEDLTPEQMMAAFDCNEDNILVNERSDDGVISAVTLDNENVELSNKTEEIMSLTEKDE